MTTLSKTDQIREFLAVSVLLASVSVGVTMSQSVCTSL